MKKVSIITDTSCDLDLDYLESIGVKYIPMTIEIDNISYKDRIDITPISFYEKISLKNVYPKTSLVSPKDFEDAFKKELALGNDVICITLSSKLSGTYNSAILAKNSIESDKIIVIDSKSASSGIGMLVIEAAKLVSSNKSATEIETHINNIIEKQQSFVYIDSMEMLKRNGRIPKALATIGSLLSIKPILTLENGSLELLSKSRGQKIAFKYILDEIKKRDIDLSYPIMIVHAEAIDSVNTIKDTLSKSYPNAQFIISKAGPSIGSHSGKGAIAVWVVEK